ncbi:MAG: efflux RND transporter permease subunit [Ignavibacteria bacterium]|nr:efflux RND transporter permease subunit [Ignavibacteria bacterium]
MIMIDLSLKRPLIVFVLFATIALLGFATFSMLNIDLMPKFETNVVTVATVYPGASASEVESSVTKKLEDALSTLENLDKMTSVSQEGVSFTTIELKSAADPNQAVQDAQRKINSVLATLPTGVKSPVISKFSPSEMPIMKIALTAEMPPAEFYKIAEDRIKPRLSKLKGVGEVSLLGGSEREIKVNVNRDKLKSYNLSILQVLMAIQKANQDFPTGKVEETNKQYTVRLSAKYSSLEELKNTAIAVFNNQSKVLVKDVAEVEDGIAEQTQLSRLNNASSIGIQVQKQSDANTVEVARLVRNEIKEIEKEYASNHMRFEIATDNSTYTMEAVNSVVEDLLLAILIVSVVSFLFLHSLRSAMIVMVAVPLSMLPAFIFLYLFGYTLNIMSLMALSLAVGILVDDSIVVVENIYRYLEMGKTRFEAALQGAKQILYTAISITLVIVIVFLPLMVTGGIIGNILKEFALPLVISTLSSLLVSFTLTPLLLSKFGRLEDISSDTFMGRFSRTFENGFNKVKGLYAGILRYGLSHRKTLYAGVVALFIASLTLFPAGLIGTAFIPDTDQGEFVVDLEMSPQISVSANNMLTKRVEGILASKKEVVKIFTNVGYSGNMLSSTAKNNVTQLTVTIVDKKYRTIGVNEYGKMMKEEIAAKVPGVKVRVSPTSVAGGAGTAPVQFVINGTDMEKIRSTATMLMDIMKKTPGTSDVKYSIDDPKPEVKIQIDRQKMEQLGLSIADVGATMRTALAGNTDSKYTDGPFEYDINLAFDKFDRKNSNDVGSITFINSRGEAIELNQFAEITQTMGPSMLERTDRNSSITVSCFVIGRGSGTVGDEIKKGFEGRIPAGVTIKPAGMLKTQGEAFSSLGYAMIAALIQIYLTMVTLYNSLLHPVVVLFSIPVALIGSFFALGLTLENLTIFSIVGLITLMGLVAKNAILLVDFTNHLRAEGRELKEALIEAGKERLRPILMTTAAMIFGMLPVALASGAGAEMKNGMAWVIIGGLTSSLFLTLVLVPSIYMSFETIKMKLKRKNAGKEAAEAELENPAYQK